ncbi:hypothetical protein QBC46DRAFT_400657 [Diplogelasinospora grovesii]|uniref:Uncharacterized protein n=1 Tax=Diplogelasinospora grovesii TaxID=303347 RepID=A0AAN6MVA3_9PEZI|nr:hypothetical protein QBC46DRAFT_400657 [Diplogelasinospora grovesii]
MLVNEHPALSSPADAEGAAYSGNTQATGILCRRTIEQKSQPIPFDVTDLLKIPPSDEDWVSCLVPADQSGPPGSKWRHIEHFPGIHEVRKTGDGESYEFAVRRSYIPWLLSRGFPFQRLFVMDHVLEPIEGEVRVYGVLRATERAKSRFLRAAVRGLSSGLGRGLDQYYRHKTLDQSVRVIIEWTILIRDIVNSDHEILRRFLLRCVYLGLHLLGDFDSAPALKLVNRDVQGWIQYFRQLGSKKAMWPLAERDSQAGLHEVALLRGVFESVGGREGVRQRWFDGNWTANDSFAAFGNLLLLDLDLDLDFDLAEPASFGSFDVQKMTEALLRSRVLKGECLRPGISVGFSVLPGEQLLQYIPIGVSEAIDGVLPAGLVHDIGYGKVNEIRDATSLICHEVPSLKDGEVDILVLVCHRAGWSPVDEGLRRWLASKEGKRFYRQTMAAIRESEALELKVLAAVTLLCCSRVLHGSPDNCSAPAYRAYLWDFGRMLHGRPVQNEQVVLERMVLSIRRVLGEECHPAVRYYLDIAVQSELPLDLLDGLSDQYWSCMLHHQQQHRDAWEETRRVFKSRMSSGGHSGWDSENEAG